MGEKWEMAKERQGSKQIAPKDSREIDSRPDDVRQLTSLGRGEGVTIGKNVEHATCAGPVRIIRTVRVVHRVVTRWRKWSVPLLPPLQLEPEPDPNRD